MEINTVLLILILTIILFRDIVFKYGYLAFVAEQKVQQAKASGKTMSPKQMIILQLRIVKIALFNSTFSRNAHFNRWSASFLQGYRVAQENQNSLKQKLQEDLNKQKKDE